MKYIVSILEKQWGSVEVEADGWSDAADKALESCAHGNTNWTTSHEEVTGVELCA